jgi:hypothetical protein
MHAHLILVDDRSGFLAMALGALARCANELRARLAGKECPAVSDVADSRPLGVEQEGSDDERSTDDD